MRIVIYKIKQYYREKFLEIRNKFERTMPISVFLISFWVLQLLAFLINENVFSQMSSAGDYILPAIRWLFKVIRIYPIFQTTDLDGIILLMDIITVLLIVFLAITIILSYLQASEEQQAPNIKASKTTFQEISLKQRQIKGQSKFIQILLWYLEMYLSMILQCYQYVLHQPMIYCQIYTIVNVTSKGNVSIFQYQGLIVAILSLFITLPLTVFQHLHTFDFRYVSDDYLAQKINGWNTILFILNYFLIILTVFVSLNQAQLFIGIIYMVISILISYKGYVYQQVKVTNLIGIISGQCIPILFYAALINSFDIRTQSFGLYCLISLPLMLQIQQMILKFQQSKVNLFDHDNIPDLELKLRQLYYQCKTTFTPVSKQVKGTNIYHTLSLHSFAANHLRLCQYNSARKVIQGKHAVKECFCYGFFPNQSEMQLQSWNKYGNQDDMQDSSEQQRTSDSFDDQKTFKRFIYELIKLHYEQYFEEHPQDASTDLWFSYIYFVFQVVKQPTKAFYEAINLKNKPQFISMKNLMIIEAAVQDAKANFDKMIVKKNLKNQKFNLQRVFEFDQSMDGVKMNFLSTMYAYKKWYGLMVNEVINLDQVQDKGFELLQIVQRLFKQLEITFQTNPLSTEADSLFYLYYKYVNINSRRPKELKRDSNLAFTFIQSLQNEIFNRESCVIYISLMNPIGTVKQYTKNFKKFSGCEDLEIMNQNIRQFMPDILAVHHDMYLTNFIEKGRMNIVMAEHRFLLLKNKSRFVVPVQAKIRLENYSTQDFGASALVTKVNNQMHYIVINKYGQLEEISQVLFREICEKLLRLDLKAAKGLDCLKLIPQLFMKFYELDEGQAEEDEQEKQGLINLEQIYEGNIVVPRLQSQIDKLLLNKKQVAQHKFRKYMRLQEEVIKQYFANISDCTIFQVKFKILSMKTINMDLKIIEIQHFKLIKSFQKEKSIQQLKTLQVTKKGHMNKRLFGQDNVSNKQSSSTGQNMSTLQALQNISNGQAIQPVVDQVWECNLEDDLVHEEDMMVTKKSFNFIQTLQTRQLHTEYSKINKTDNELTPFGHDDEVQMGSSALQPSQQSFLPLGLQQMQNNSKENEQYSLESDDSLQNSSSKNNKGQVQQEASVASSSAYDDSRTKKRMIRDVLIQNTDSKKTQNTYMLTKLSILLLIFFYSLNFGLTYTSLDILKSAAQTSRIGQQLRLKYNQQIIATFVENLNSYLNQSKFTSIINTEYQTQLESISNQDDAFENSTKIMSLQLYLNMEDAIRQSVQTFYAYNYHYQMLYSSDLKAYIERNMLQYQTSFIYIDELFEKEKTTQIDQISTTSQIVFIISEIVILFLLVSILPIYLLMQKSRVAILSLFTTFTNGQLVAQYQIYNKLIIQCEQSGFLTNEAKEDDFEKQNFKSMFKSMKPDGKPVHKFKQNKIKNILQSNTPFIVMVFVLIILSYMIFSIYLITSFIIQTQLINNYQYSNTDIVTFDTVTDYVSNFTSLKIVLLKQDIQLQKLFDGQGIHIIKESIEFQIQLPLFEQLIQGMTQSNRYTPNIQNIVNNNSCLIFTDYPGSSNYSQLFNSSICSKLGNLNQGIGIAIASFYQSYKQIFDQLSGYQDLTTLSAGLASIGYSDFDYGYSLYLQYCIDSFSDFLQKSIISDTQSSQTTQIVIFSIGICFILAFYFFCEQYFGEKLMNQITKTKQLLTLLPFELLLENAYIMTFIVKESKKINL